MDNSQNTQPEVKSGIISPLLSIRDNLLKPMAEEIKTANRIENEKISKTQRLCLWLGVLSLVFSVLSFIIIILMYLNMN